MVKPPRLATFNCENLFSRAKVLNLRSKDDTASILNQITGLQKLLAKASYSSADKTKILQFSKDLNF